MWRMRNLSSAHVLALIALFVALGSNAGAGVTRWISGSDIRNASIDGSKLVPGTVGSNEVEDASIRIRDLTPAATALLKGAVGAQGAKGDTGQQGPQGPVGPGGQNAELLRFSAVGPNLTNYVDLSPIATLTPTATGVYILTTSFDVTNTGASNEYLDCRFMVDGTPYGAAGADTTAGAMTHALSVTVAEVGAGQTATFMCRGSGATSYDISTIKIGSLRID